MFRADDGFRKLPDRGNPLVSCRQNQRRVRLQILAMDDNATVAINQALQNIMRRGINRRMSESQKRSEKFALHGVCDGFQAVVSVQFLIDVVQMVAQGLQSYFQRACNFTRVLACRKESQNFLFPLGKRRDRHRVQCYLLYVRQLTRNSNHLV